MVSWGLQAQGVALCSSPVRGLLLVLRGLGSGLRALLCTGSAQALREEPGQGRPAAFCPVSSWAVLLLGEAPGDGLPACAPFPVGSPRGAHCLGMDGLLSVAVHLLFWALPVFPGPPDPSGSPALCTRPPSIPPAPLTPLSPLLQWGRAAPGASHGSPFKSLLGGSSWQLLARPWPL